MKPVTCSNLLYLAEPENRIVADEIRHAMSATERMQVTHPDTMAKRARAHIKARVGAAKARLSPMEKLKQEIAELKRKLERSDDGSLFDLKRDCIEDIAAVMISTSKSRAKSIAEAVLKKLKQDTAPAG